ncbi:hypothetical protein GYMLUDRAFT_54322 [Collybiopsis luxurians FD-317 M1]|nr:hypothetical protein GYMLUDRAFT_54322 [Collybiopsis luxurians FD-317 M1]
MFRAIGYGMKLQPLRSLKTILICYDVEETEDSVFWEAVGPNTQVILEMEVQARSETPGLKRALISCFQDYSLLCFLSETICGTWDSVQEICIDFNPTYPDPNFASLREGDRDRWAKLDFMFMQRHERGALKRLCFRCTRCDDLCSCAEMLYACGLDNSGLDREPITFVVT